MVTARRILLVEDDESLRRILAEQLEVGREFETVQAATAAEALEAAANGRIDVVLLDIGLPDMDGRTLCRELRDAGMRQPIIMLTGADSEADTVQGLDSGANDYVVKPFRLAELLARLRAHLRQHEQSDEAILPIGPYTFQPSRKFLVEGGSGKRIRLTEKEAAILKFLYRAETKAVDRDTLLHEVWGYSPGLDTHTLETHVYRLRQKIERDPSKAEILVTDAGGYRLVP